MQSFRSSRHSLVSMLFIMQYLLLPEGRMVGGQPHLDRPRTGLEIHPDPIQRLRYAAYSWTSKTQKIREPPQPRLVRGP